MTCQLALDMFAQIVVKGHEKTILHNQDNALYV